MCSQPGSATAASLGTQAVPHFANDLQHARMRRIRCSRTGEGASNAGQVQELSALPGGRVGGRNRTCAAACGSGFSRRPADFKREDACRTGRDGGSLGLLRADLGRGGELSGPDASKPAGHRCGEEAAPGRRQPATARMPPPPPPPSLTAIGRKISTQLPTLTVQVASANCRFLTSTAGTRASHPMSTPASARRQPAASSCTAPRRAAACSAAKRGDAQHGQQGRHISVSVTSQPHPSGTRWLQLVPLRCTSCCLSCRPARGVWREGVEGMLLCMVGSAPACRQWLAGRQQSPAQRNTAQQRHRRRHPGRALQLAGLRQTHSASSASGGPTPHLCLHHLHRRGYDQRQCFGVHRDADRAGGGAQQGQLHAVPPPWLDLALGTKEEGGHRRRGRVAMPGGGGGGVRRGWGRGVCRLGGGTLRCTPDVAHAAIGRAVVEPLSGQAGKAAAAVATTVAAAEAIPPQPTCCSLAEPPPQRLTK